MYLGPIHPTNPWGSQGHSPVKPIKVTMQDGKQTVLLDNTYPYALQPDVVDITVDTVLYTNSQSTLLSLIHQIEELGQNAEWQRAGLFIQWREDGVSDGEDGWYVVKSVDISEDFVFSAYAEPKIDVELRVRQQSNIGIYVDAKAVPNDYNLSGTTMAVYPPGMNTTIYPLSGYSNNGKDASVLQVVENAPSVMKAQLLTPLSVMNSGRCSVFDSTVNDSVATEVFWKDHRNLNGYYKFDNQLVRYTVNMGGGGDPLIEVASSGAWVTMGNYQLVGGSATVQSLQLGVISPEEVTWTEERYGTFYFYRVLNRLRRGSKIIESSIVAAGNTSFNSAGAIQITNVPFVANASGALLAPDTTSLVGVGQAAVVPGFLYLNRPANAGGMTGNLLTADQSSFETSSAGYLNTTNVTVTQTAAQALDGTKSLQMASVAAGAMATKPYTGATGVPVYPGQTVTASAFFRAAVSVRSCQVNLQWYCTDGTLLINSNGTIVADTTSGWTQLFCTAVAPASAAFVSPQFVVGATGAANEIHYIDEVSINYGSSVSWALGGAALSLDSGYTLPAGTITRLGIACGLKDSLYNNYARPSPVTSLTVTPQGTTGATTYAYIVIGVSSAGVWSVITLASTATGNATLTNVNKNHLAWVDGANDNSYIIAKVVGSTVITIGTAGFGATTFDDTGLPSLGGVSDMSPAQRYTTQLSSYNRTRVRTRLLVGG